MKTKPAFDAISSCLDGYDPEALRVDVAREFIAQLLPRPTLQESVGVRAALGRVLAEDIVSTVQVPAHDNAAMDGYALRGLDIQTAAETHLHLAGSSLAGSAPVSQLPPGHCQRIMTGALMPAGLDTVVPQEFTRTEGALIVIPAGVVKPGANRRLAGEDLALGGVPLRAGRLLQPADLGVLTSLGLAKVPVWRKLRVALMSTGDELRSVDHNNGEPLPPGCVYDSNRTTMWAMLTRLGVEVIDLGVVRDDPVLLRDALMRASHEADAILTSGGVSVGEADHTRRVIAELGEVLFWKLAMRPGRPLAVGRIGQAILFGLPGNPVAVMVSFYAFVRDALLAMGGARPNPLPMLRAASTRRLSKKPGRTEYQRGIVSRAQDGHWQVELAGNQGSGVLSSMSQANGLVVLGHDQGEVAAGDWVDVLPFEGLI